MVRSYGEVAALRGVDLVVDAGEVHCLLGRNGAGKTTLVSILGGLLPADSGTVLVEGRPVQGPQRNASAVGLAPQEIGIYPTLTVVDNLRLPAELHGGRGAAAREAVDAALDALDLVPLADRIAGTLSGGQKRRLHVAMALVHRPRLLILDEPTAGADVQTRNRLVALVGALAAEGVAVCYSTHYLAEIEGLDATISIMEEGQVVARGTATELVAAHGEAFVEVEFEDDLPALVPGEIARTDRRVRIRVDPARRGILDVLDDLQQAGAPPVRSVESFSPSLESVFLTVTGRRLADVR